MAFFDSTDLTRDNDDHATERLATIRAEPPWGSENQAAVHTWYQGQ
ncbi:nucleotidyltransferase family protein [Micromonospora pisi]